MRLSKVCHLVSGEGDRQFTGRKSLTEILSEHENRSKTATNLNNTNTTSPNDQKNSNAQDFNSQLAAAVEKRNATAQEVLNKSNYPKSDRLLQLINQSVTPNKPSYLNTFGQQNSKCFHHIFRPSVINYEIAHIMNYGN